jgi:two-component system response regulator AtoC
MGAEPSEPKPFMRHILVVEQDDGLRQALQLALREAGYAPQGVATVAAAERALEAGVFAGVLAPADARLAADLGRRHPEAVVVALVAPGDEEAGLRALRQGAHDYVPRQADPAALVAALRKAEARVEAARPARAGAPARAATVTDLIGDGAAMTALKTALAKVAQHKTTVLVRGESGTGKEVVARALHRLSPRGPGAPGEGPFVAVNCGAIPPGLLESELFGHRKGAFTDAVRDRQGLVEQAAGGTLFLDEIAELPPALQVKLLRVLQDQRIRRLGDDVDVAVDVRVVAATARPLEAEVAAGRFRQDLFYRLDVVTLELPPLRERADDIPTLAAHFLARTRARLGIGVARIAPEAMDLLVAYRWPGNVRELENTIERAAVLCEGEAIDAASLPERLYAPPPAPAAPGDEPTDLSIKRAARRSEEALIRRALAKTGGNRARAAELLEISHRALLYKIKEYGI